MHDKPSGDVDRRNCLESLKSWFYDKHFLICVLSKSLVSIFNRDVQKYLIEFFNHLKNGVPLLLSEGHNNFSSSSSFLNNLPAPGKSYIKDLSQGG